MKPIQHVLAGLAFVLLAFSACADDMSATHAETQLNPCAAKTINPCAAKTLNPCAAKTLNPCAAKTLNPCAAKTLNPCAAKTLNPCLAKALNPCAAKALNPCQARASNPCMAKHVKPNPCAAKNPCSAKNPCNPCGGGGGVDASRFTQPRGVTVAAANPCLVKQGEKLWNDRGLGESGLACSTCHTGNYGQMKASFAKPFPHTVAMPAQQAGVSQVNAAEMVNFCMIVPMADEPLGWGSQELAALAAYVEHIQPGFTPPHNPCAARNPCGGH